MDAANTAVSLLKSAIDGLEFIRLASTFDSEYNIQRIKLDILQIRLTRWAEAVGLGASEADSKPGSTPLRVSSENEMKKLLKDIKDLIREKQKASAKMNKSMMDPDDLPRSDGITLRSKLRESIQKRRNKLGGVVKGIQWAFYEKTSFESFVGNISDVIKNLEGLFPPEQSGWCKDRLATLSREECEDIPSGARSLLQNLAVNCDPWLKVAAAREKEKATINTMTMHTNNGMATNSLTGDVNGLILGANHTITQNVPSGKA